MYKLKLTVLVLLSFILSCDRDKDPQIGKCGEPIMERVENNEGLLVATIFGSAVFSMDYGLIVICNFEDSELNTPVTGSDAREIIFSGTIEHREYPDYIIGRSETYPNHRIEIDKITFVEKDLTLPEGLFIAIDEYHESDTVGYGYRVEVEGFRLLADAIPSVPGFWKFKSLAEAKKMAYLTGWKLYWGGGLPTIEPEELCFFLIRSSGLVCDPDYYDLLPSN